MKKWLNVALMTMFVVCVPAAPLFAMPQLLEQVIKERNFFVGFEEYSTYRLCDVRRLLSAQWLGVMLLDPSGIELRLVFDLPDGQTIFRDAFIPEKGQRDTLRRRSISVADAVKLAQAARQAYRER